MGKVKIPPIKLLSMAAIAGNIFFMLWITVNGLKEHFRGTIYEKLSYAALMILLLVNSLLIFFRRNHN